MLLTDNKFNTILLTPAEKGADELIVFSAYASASFIATHLSKLQEKKLDVTIKLFVGMKSGISKEKHLGFKKLSEIANNFDCKYYLGIPEVHSKLYKWNKNGNNYISFMGSSNYTNQGFDEGIQGNIMTKCDPQLAEKYLTELEKDSIGIFDYVVQEKEPNLKTKQLNYENISLTPTLDGDLFTSADQFKSLEKHTLNFLDKKGNLPPNSGLNWGQPTGTSRRPYQKNKNLDSYNQAYIPIRASEVPVQFIPPRGEHFIVFTDDKNGFFMSAVQGGKKIGGKQYGKGFQTPKLSDQNNSTLGLYFRKRLDVPSGSPVKRQDLMQYGRTNVDLWKMDHDTFYMDFGVNN